MSLLQFDKSSLDLDRRELRVDGEPVDVQPLVFDLLSFLARHPRRVVSRTELLAAVWPSTHVSDSVVARAVMKARRAINDDGSAPRLLRTLPRSGYLLEADVVEHRRSLPSPHQHKTGGCVGLALLTFELSGVDASQAWMSEGLTGLLHHLLERSNALTLVPLAEVRRAQDERRRADTEDPLAHACAWLGCTEALLVRISWTGARFDLLAWRGQTLHSASQRCLSGTDAFAMMSSLADALVAGPLIADTDDRDLFWQEQLARVISMQQAGQSAQALDLLLLCRDQLPPSRSLELLQARLLHETNRLDEACARIERTMQGRRASDATDVQLMALMAQCHYEAERLLPAQAHFEQALLASARIPEARGLRPDIFCRAANVATRQGLAAQAIDWSEEAATEADRMGNLDIRARAWLNLGSVLLQMDQPHRAERPTQLSIELAHRSGQVEYQARSWRLQANFQTYRRHFSDALISIRRSIALWVRTGQVAMQWWARLMELVILIESDRLQEAQRVASAMQQASGLQAGHRQSLELLQAVLCCRLGRVHEGVSGLAQLACANAETPTMTQMLACGEWVFQLISLGRLGEAEQAMQGLAGMPTAGYRERRESALALARGDRPAALALLRDLWQSRRVRGLEGSFVCADLTWMMIEDLPPGFEDPVVESLFVHAVDASEELLATRLIQAAYLLRRSPQAPHRQRWDEAVASGISLHRRAPMLLTASYREALATGEPPRLGELLSRVCW